jgi:hypothetical protein
VIHPAEEGGYWAEVPALPYIPAGDRMKKVTIGVFSVRTIDV